MRLKVRYFASIREFTRLREEEIELSDGATADTLKHSVLNRHTSLKGLESNILVAINGSFVDPNRVLKPGDEVALFPPVSGG